MHISQQITNQFKTYLYEEEKSRTTVTKYMADLAAFQRYLCAQGAGELTKEAVLTYKQELTERYRATSVNSKLAALNSFFQFIGQPLLRVKPLKIQKRIFCAKEKELTKAEYFRLLSAAAHQKNRRIGLVIQTICATGIRVSELRFITSESLLKGRAEVASKGKTRIVFLTKKLCQTLRAYCLETGVKTGPIFVTRSGNPLDRSNIWSDMKRLCQAARVSEEKVFPHNLRHLFARSFYSASRDIAKLADLLGHSSIDTTRIYILSSGEEHQRKIEHLGLVV